jgi:hypothetical protein
MFLDLVPHIDALFARALTHAPIAAFAPTLAQTTPAPADGASGPGATLLKFVTGGGIIGYIIVALSIAAMALVVIHAVQIRKQTLIPPDKVRTLKEMLAEGQAEAALEYCLLPSNDCYLCRILAPGLTRYLRSKRPALKRRLDSTARPTPSE